MNKTIAYVSSIVAVLGLATAWTFGTIDGFTFGTISATVLAAIFAAYKNFELGVVNMKLSKMESNLFSLDVENKKLKNINTSLKTAVLSQDKIITDLQTKVETPVIVIEPVPITVTEADEVVKPVSKRKKK